MLATRGYSRIYRTARVYSGGIHPTILASMERSQRQFPDMARHVPSTALYAVIFCSEIYLKFLSVPESDRPPSFDAAVCPFSISAYDETLFTARLLNASIVGKV